MLHRLYIIPPLLSKYPFFTQMEKCLESLRFTIANHRINPSEIYKLLVYLTKSVPIPPVGTRLNFPLPYYPDFISINQPKYKDIFLSFEYSTKISMSLFSVSSPREYEPKIHALFIGWVTK